MIRNGAVLISLFALIGCHRNTLEAEEAAVAWDATSQELQRSASEPRLVGGMANGSFELDCLDGGTLAGTGEWDAEANLEELSAVSSFAYELEMVGCTRNGVVIDGFIDFEGEAGASVADLSAEAWFAWRGELEYTGDIEGNCVIDVEASAWAEVGSGGEASFEGRVCGEKVSALP